MGSEWSWDLGADGVVRLVVDDQGIETIYRAGRIVARSPAGGSRDGHIVTLPARLPQGEAFREASIPARELRLRRERWADGDAWQAALEGLDIAPISVRSLRPSTSIAAAPIVAPKRGSGWLSGILLMVVCGVIASAFTAKPTWQWAKVTLARRSLTNASHQTALKQQWFSSDSNVNIMSPSDFEALPPQAFGVAITRKGNAEAFAAIFITNPNTDDLDEILRAAGEGGRRALPPGFDFVHMDAPTSGDCNGMMGRITGGMITSRDRDLTLKLWICVSQRSGVTVAGQRPTIQLFVYTVPDFLADRDEPVFRAMIKQAEVKELTAPSPVDPFGPSKFDAFRKKR